MGTTRSLLRSLKLNGRIEYFLLLTGANLVLLSFIMLRHVTIAFRQTDVALGVFGVALFAGVSLGFGISDRVSLVTIRRAIPVLLLVQMAMILLIPSFYHVLSRDVGTWSRQHELPEMAGDWVATAAIFLFVMVAVSTPYSVFLPLIIQSQTQNLRRYMSITIAGAVIGLTLAALLGFLTHLWLLAGYFATFVAVSLALGSDQRVLVGLVAVIVVFLVNFGKWDQASAAWLYERRFGSEVRDVTQTQYTTYHKIEVLELDSGARTVAIDGRLQVEKDTDATHHYLLAEYPALRFERPEVCALGGATVPGIARIREHAASFRIVDLDETVLSFDRGILADLDKGKALLQVVDDPKHFLATTDERFDLILHALPPARSRRDALPYTAEFFTAAKARLTTDGVLSIACPSLLSDESSYGKKLLATLVHVFERHVVVSAGDAAFFYGGVERLSAAEEEALRSALERLGHVGMRVLAPGEIDDLVENVGIITVGTVGELIYG